MSQIITVHIIGDTFQVQEPGEVGNFLTDAWNTFTEDRSLTKAAQDLTAIQLHYGTTGIADILRKANFPENIIPWAVAQVLFETNGLNSHVSQADNNLSGIVWLNKPYQHATKGSARPNYEGGNYARFATLQDWANDYKRILSLGGSNSPISAPTLREFVNRLKANHYFMSNADIYFRGLQLLVQAAPGAKGIVEAGEASGDISYPKGKDGKGTGFQAWWDGLSKMEKGIGIAAAALLGIAVIKK